MNILVPDSWLREYLKTKATPKQIAKYLSLSSQSVERLIKNKDDWIYEIEITTNRPDCLSIYGIARELKAVLPRYGIKTYLKPILVEDLTLTKTKNNLPLKVEIKNKSLCPRFTAIIFEQISIKPSPQIIQDRLNKAGIRALNNVVDISNYLMLELGQPMHTFDYDKIQEAKMILRESKRGEKIITLDNCLRTLPEGAIIIQDGQGRIIDLCGIMGGKNSQVDEKTQRVLLFVQTYDPVKIRQTSQKLAFHTEAASRFEKGIEPEGIIPAISKAILLFEKNCQAKIASNLIDIYPQASKPKKVILGQEKLNQLLGVKISLIQAKKYLASLGFICQLNQEKSKLTAQVPYWRLNDIDLPEDLIEEVARIYGYHKLPNVLPVGEIPYEKNASLNNWKIQIKQALKFWGFTEIYSYSLVSKNLLTSFYFHPENYLKLINPLTLDWIYLRPSLIPSLFSIVAQNQDNLPMIKIFEMANIYLPRLNQLPEEKLRLTGAISGDSFYQAKGTVEAILNQLGINNFSFDQPNKTINMPNFWHPLRQAILKIKAKELGTIGEIHPQIRQNLNLKMNLSFFDLDLQFLIDLASSSKSYSPISQYPPIIEDLSFIIRPKTLVGHLIQAIADISPIIKSVELIDTYQDSRTIRITYQSNHKTLTDREVKKTRQKIIRLVEKSGRGKLKTIS